jgi:peptidyl-tRNA hydrolase
MPDPRTTHSKADETTPVGVEATPKEEAPPKPVVAELIIRTLEDGHAVNLAAKITQPDGTTLDQVVEATSTKQELRIPLNHLQEVLVRAKVVSVSIYNPEQMGMTSIPADELTGLASAPEPKEGTGVADAIGAPGRIIDPDENKVEHERHKSPTQGGHSTHHTRR